MADEVTAKPKRLTSKKRIFVDKYLATFNATEAARAAGHKDNQYLHTNARKLLQDTTVKAEIEARLAESHVTADEALQVIEKQMRADISVFFRQVEEWTFYPLPTYEILGEKEVMDNTDEKNPKTRISYWVRHVVIDTDKLVDPQYSYLLKEFSDSPKNGLSIKLYDKQQAALNILKMHGKFTERVDITSKGESINKIDEQQFDTAISKLADALRKSVPRTPDESNGAVGSSK